MPQPQPMTGTQLYTLATSLNMGQSINIDLFYNLVGVAQAKLEGERDWMILKAQDNSETITPAVTFQTSFVLPADFQFWQSERPIILVDPTNTQNFIDWYKEVPLIDGWRYQFQTYKYFVDYAKSLIYFAGTVDKTYTIYKNYILQPPAIDANTPWVFPAKFHPIIAFDVVEMYKSGADYDEINIVSSKENARVKEALHQAMVDWDDKLQRRSLEGLDRGPQDDRPFHTGHVNIFN